MRGQNRGEEAAFEVAAEFAFGQCRGIAATAVVVQHQPGGEVRLDDAVENRTFGAGGKRPARRSIWQQWQT